MSWLNDYLATAKPHFVDPEHPCRIMPSRACPLSYEGVCGERPCARYESEDEAPWQADMERDKALGLWARPSTI